MAHRVEGGRELRSTAARIVVLDVHHLGGQVDVGARNARHRLDRTPDSFPGGMRAVAFVEQERGPLRSHAGLLAGASGDAPLAFTNMHVVAEDRLRQP
jgi:hypothetical protein